MKPEWQTIPPEQSAEWDDFYRAIAAHLFGHCVQKAAAVVSLDGQDWLLSLDLKLLQKEILH
jgi:hypothetical protein